MVRADVIVLGAGPAGARAAITVAGAGLEVILLDEARAAGGQVYRAPAEGLGGSSPDRIAGDSLRRQLAESRVQVRFGRRVWIAAPGFEVSAVGPEGSEDYKAPALIVAAGTSERVIPVPGVTLPGVVGLAGATILLKADGMLPGARTVVAGVGPLLAAVAAGILKGGGQVAAVVDLAARGDWLHTLPALASRPDLLARGAGWMAKIRAKGVPVLYRHAVAEVRGGTSVEEVIVRPVDGEGRATDGPARSFGADALAIGHGLVPATEVARLLGAEHDYRAPLGGWVARRDDDTRTTVEGLYVAGDGAGVRGAAAAEIEGEIAGLTAALDLGRIRKDAHADAVGPLRRRLARAARFGGAMGAMMAIRPGLVASIPPETVVCRCEGVTRAEIDAAIAGGVRHLNQLKSTTRCGMGPCQGRMCGEAAAELVAAAAGSREAAGIWTARPPLRPVPMAALLGRYDYDDIPKPAPAPA